MGKTINTLLFITLAYLLPLAGRPGLILHYKIIILVGAALAVFLTQPGLELKEARQEQERDRNSVLIILVLSLFSAAIPVIEWAYWPSGRHSPVAMAVGMTLILAGVGIRIWAIRTLGAFFTATVQIKGEHRLVREGPYRLVRHPSYLGAFMATLGCAILLQSWVGLLLAAALMLLAYSIRIKVEEEALIQAFGEQYTAFQQEAKKMIPFLW
ncbi:MAG: isoprenylcysteine carboxylmethyltransferase family protein [Lewinellaceae bacterium]|nr:isoprenylcysteine carboxylmethyltransferase family protein [Phaeodactylibacter sp.]MCB0613042.1 isoprenylcysteine carboxylmethyltransferase family protein [Phaeodactylibacter sp.]MCB9347100.1 isoprenylcysteine carboxylmethyltransferase family protein [Lewinellaceae bacterium]